MKRNENSFGTQSLSLSFSRKSGSRIRSFAARRSISKLRASRSDLRMEKNGGSGISYSATLLESKEFWQQVEEKEGLEGGDGSRANEFSNFVSSRLSSITTRPGIFGAIFPPLSLQGHRKGWKRKQSRARSSLNGTPSVVALHRYRTSRASCSRKSDASKSILALLVSREIDQI